MFIGENFIDDCIFSICRLSTANNYDPNHLKLRGPNSVKLLFISHGFELILADYLLHLDICIDDIEDSSKNLSTLRWNKNLWKEQRKF